MITHFGHMMDLCQINMDTAARSMRNMPIKGKCMIK
jgi:hypothetical protein